MEAARTRPLLILMWISPYSHTNERNAVDLNNFYAIIRQIVIARPAEGESVQRFNAPMPQLRQSTYPDYEKNLNSSV